MLDIQLLRNQIDAVAERLATRGLQLDTGAFLALEDERKEFQTRTQELQARRNALSKQIGALKGQGKTVILTTHYIEEVQALSDRVAIIDYGELIALGTPQELMAEHAAKDLEEVFLKITGRRIVEGI